jgi:uncharacterized membrane protein
MKTTILGGILFLVPVAFVAIILQKAFEISKAIAKPIDAMIPIENFAGIAFANVIAVLLILFVCFVAGLIARKELFSNRLKKLDYALMDTVPGYAAVKALLAGMAGEATADTLLKPVLVRFDDYDQIAFEVEATEDKATIFLPGSPSAGAGSTVIVDQRRITTLNMPPHKAISLMRVMGRGSLKIPEVQAASS